jgi:hypothetical protein
VSTGGSDELLGARAGEEKAMASLAMMSAGYDHLVMLTAKNRGHQSQGPVTTWSQA